MIVNNHTITKKEFRCAPVFIATANLPSRNYPMYVTKTDKFERFEHFQPKSATLYSFFRPNGSFPQNVILTRQVSIPVSPNGGKPPNLATLKLEVVPPQTALTEQKATGCDVFEAATVVGGYSNPCCCRRQALLDINLIDEVLVGTFNSKYLIRRKAGKHLKAR